MKIFIRCNLLNCLVHFIKLNGVILAEPLPTSNMYNVYLKPLTELYNHVKETTAFRILVFSFTQFQQGRVDSRTPDLSLSYVCSSFHLSVRPSTYANSRLKSYISQFLSIVRTPAIIVETKVVIFHLRQLHSKITRANIDFTGYTMGEAFKYVEDDIEKRGLTA